ncbi:MAG: hypothetical protein WD397_03785 [Wenzhouxiangellaceae bacterium]
MKAHRSITYLSVALLAAVSMTAQAFESGSTGADGAFNPTVDTVLPLPDDGVFNFTSVNVPAGVTVRFERNALNTPVRMLVAEDALIDGVIDVRGGNSPAIGSAGDGVIADDGLPGRGGPGGFDGGVGGSPGSSEFAGGQGIGPGGGFPNESQVGSNGTVGCAGGGGGFGTSGVTGRGSHCFTSHQVAGGPDYGNERLLPLIGGSGGGGGAGGASFAGSGGGGGGGALLIAVSGTLTVNGTIRANGGNSGDFSGAGHGGGGGGGAGGGIRMIATTIAGEGAITARGGQGYSTSTSIGGGGGAGRIRFEAETMNRSAGTTPQFSFAEPGPVFLTGMPSIRIASVGGVDAPAVPSGTADIVLEQDFPNPVEVVVEAFNVPLGNTATITLTPATGQAFSVITNALDGTEAASSAMAQIEVPDGPSTLLASVSFTVPEDQNMAFQHITDGEPVREIRLLASIDGASRTVLITEAGREVEVPGSLLR